MTPPTPPLFQLAMPRGFAFHQNPKALPCVGAAAATIGLCTAYSLPAQAQVQPRPQPATNEVTLSFALPHPGLPSQAERSPTQPHPTTPTSTKHSTIALGLTQAAHQSKNQATSQISTQPVDEILLDQMFAGDADSLVARAVGAAEGTRTPSGDYTPAYYGHLDPGNGVWNMGSFSYQHGAESPEEADRKQLARLRSQSSQIYHYATAQDVPLSLEEMLNAIDLANQAPLAALAEDGGNYIDRLQQAQAMGLQKDDAVLWARTYAYVDPSTNRWNAPGLGNNPDRISDDQHRRQQAIARAIATHPPHTTPHPPHTTPHPPHATPHPSPPIEILVPGELDQQTTIAQQIIFQDL